MTLLPIEVETTRNKIFQDSPECAEIVAIFQDHYQKTGFHKPWIVYVFSNEAGEFIGAGGFKDQPREGKVEITYGTFSRYQGRGIGTEICKNLLQLARKMDPSLTIIAHTVPDNLASIAVLQKNGFVQNGKVWDEEDGELLLWEQSDSILNV
jgi:RimJ/RimL family protein N-acetyltransferase